ncbi:MAG: tripartite tricarboxylate transporter TctB family protein [Burkholderiaceae bacterium]
MSRALNAGRLAEWSQLAILLALLGVFYFVIVPAGIEDPADMGFDQGMPPSFSARAAAIVAALIVLGRMVQLLVGGGQPRLSQQQDSARLVSEPGEEAESDSVVISGRVVAGIAAALVYAYALLPQLGFVAGSLVLLVSLLVMLGEKSPFRLLVLPMLVTFGVWLLFVQALGVTLPTGALMTALAGG